MKIAIPVVQGRLAAHFGHCEEFALFEVDQETLSIVGSERLAAPSHQPGLLPQWLREHGTDLIIAGGMGRRAQSLFAQGGIEVAVGAALDEPEQLIKEYLEGVLETGENICDH